MLASTVVTIHIPLVHPQMPGAFHYEDLPLQREFEWGNLPGHPEGPLSSESGEGGCVPCFVGSLELDSARISGAQH